MRTKLHYIFIIVPVILIASADYAVAQEAGMPEVEIADPDKDRLEREKIISSPGEGDTRYVGKSLSSPVTKDSAATTTSPILPLSKTKTEKAPATVKPAAEKQPKNQDDSILSFNFLYYIIEKYKLQDIVD